MKWPPFFSFLDTDGFFDSVQQALENSTGWRLRARGNTGDERFLSADYVGNDFVGTDLGFALCNYADEPSKVQLTMHAVRWSEGRSHPNDSEYLSAERMTRAVFRDAAKSLKQPLRLSRPRHPRRMVGKLAKMFNDFCLRISRHRAGDTLLYLHQAEHEDFYRFICAAHRYGSALTPEELAAELRNAGLVTELSRALVEQYEVGRRVLAMGTWHWDRRSVDVWNPWNIRKDRKRYKDRARAP